MEVRWLNKQLFNYDDVFHIFRNWTISLSNLVHPHSENIKYLRVTDPNGSSFVSEKYIRLITGKKKKKMSVES